MAKGKEFGVRNRLVRSLPVEERDRLESSLEPVDLTFKKLLYDVNTPIDSAYFVDTGVASMLSFPSPEVTIEVATIGNEGFVGVPLFLGTDRAPLQTVIQIPGEGWRIGAEDFRRVVAESPAMAGLLNRYVQSLMFQIAQNSACGQSHSIQKRCARWLLMTQDRALSNRFHLTQEFLAQMLGVRRASVNPVMAEFQRDGAIRYVRGEVTILDRKALEQATCDCYRIISDEYDRLAPIGRDAADPIKNA